MQKYIFAFFLYLKKVISNKKHRMNAWRVCVCIATHCIRANVLQQCAAIAGDNFSGEQSAGYTANSSCSRTAIVPKEYQISGARSGCFSLSFERQISAFSLVLGLASSAMMWWKYVRFVSFILLCGYDFELLLLDIFYNYRFLIYIF